jgi:cytochrome c peroxidase
MKRVRAAAIVALGLVFFAVACSRGPDPLPPFVWSLPRGLPTPVVPAANPMRVAKVDLGRRLFYDSRLSSTGTFACATCHQQAKAFTDGRARAVGATGAGHPRSSMSLANVAYNVNFGWADPWLSTLEEQMLVPMFNEHPIELGVIGREAEIVARFSGDAGRFTAAFPGDPQPVNLPNIVRAIAAFERTLLSGESAFDRYLYHDDKSAMSASALRGMTLFFSDRLACAQCHAGFTLSGPVRFEGAPRAPTPSDLLFHNTGLYNLDGRGGYPDDDRGLIDRTGRAADMGRFRAATLRNIAVTAPYMHDGSVATLGGAIDHYASGGKPGRFTSDRMRPFELTVAEKADLLAFLESLTDRQFLTNAAFGPPVK